MASARLSPRGNASASRDIADGAAGAAGAATGKPVPSAADAAANGTAAPGEAGTAGNGAGVHASAGGALRTGTRQAGSARERSGSASMPARLSVHTRWRLAALERRSARPATAAEARSSVPFSSSTAAGPVLGSRARRSSSGLMRLLRVRVPRR
jgi:hypothetical protein